MSSQPLRPAGPGQPSKVPIPRLDRRGEGSSRSSMGSRQRVQRACLTCRARKIKCNGGQPKCQNCTENPTPCVYVSSRKDRLKTATEQNQDMIELLKGLRAHVPDEERSKIEDMLSGISEGVVESAAVMSKSPEKSTRSDRDFEEEPGEEEVSAEVGSNHDLDMVDEDILHDDKSRATGYMGKNSEVQWFRRLHQEADNPSPKVPDGPYGPPGQGDFADAARLSAFHQRRNKAPSLIDASSCNYYLDDEKLEMDFMTDPFELPPFEMAEKLLQCYMDNVHDSFPFVAKKTFVNQFYHYYASLGRGMPYQLPQKWQAVLNLVLAIGAVHSHLVEAAWRADHRDHLIYHSRAWSLSLKDPLWFSHPDLPQVQLTSLLAFYYLSIGHVNRAWVVVGMALRFGYSLGLHLRNEDRNASAVKKELLVRIWWAVYSLERRTSAYTGRPSIGVDDECSTPFPLPLSTEEIDEAIIVSRFGDRAKAPPAQLRHRRPSETSSASSTRPDFGFGSSMNDPPNSGSFLKSTVRIDMITQRTLQALYSPAVVKKSWESVQGLIVSLNEELEAWASALPDGLNFLRANHDQSHLRERNTLAYYYYSAKIFITRPCLCRLDRRIEHQSERSIDFNRRTAETCVMAAKSISELLPIDPSANLFQIYRLGPWWAMVHYIMQALAVLLLEIAIVSASFPHVRQELGPSLRKLVTWLVYMRTTNGMAVRACKIIIDLLKKMTPIMPEDLTNIWHETTVMASRDTQLPTESATNLSQPFLPESSLPQASLPQSSLPQSYLPQSYLPQSFFPGVPNTRQDFNQMPGHFHTTDQHMPFLQSGDNPFGQAHGTIDGDEPMASAFPVDDLGPGPMINPAFASLMTTNYDEANLLPFTFDDFTMPESHSFQD